MSVVPGDIVEIHLPEGFAYGQVVLKTAAYPPAIAFLPQLQPRALEQPQQALRRSDLKTLIVPLEPAEAAGQLRIVAQGTSAAAPRFRVPVRDRDGQVLYEWQWNGAEISLRAADDTESLPTREIVALTDLPRLLQI